MKYFEIDCLLIPACVRQLTVSKARYVCTVGLICAPFYGRFLKGTRENHRISNTLVRWHVIEEDSHFLVLSDDGAEALEEVSKVLFSHATLVVDDYLVVDDAILLTITDGSDEGDISAS